MKKAKVFQNGKSQAIRIPREYRFNSKEVAVTPLGKGIVLQPIPRNVNWFWLSALMPLGHLHEFSGLKLLPLRR